MTEVRSWIDCAALFGRVFNYSWEDEPPAAPAVRVWAETEGWQGEGGTALCFLLQSLGKVKGKFSSVQLQCRRENRRSLCDVRQNQQQVFLAGQIRGSTETACCTLSPKTVSVGSSFWGTLPLAVNGETPLFWPHWEFTDVALASSEQRICWSNFLEPSYFALISLWNICKFMKICDAMVRLFTSE